MILPLSYQHIQPEWRGQIVDLELSLDRLTLIVRVFVAMAQGAGDRAALHGD